MKLAVELFSLLVVSFFGILSPIIILLLNLSQVGVYHLTSKHKNIVETNKRSLRHLTTSEDSDQNDFDVTEKLQDNIDAFKKKQATFDRKMRLLNPTRQLRWIMAPLIATIGLLLMYYFLDEVVFIPSYYKYGCLLLAFGMFFFSIQRAYCIVLIMIEVQAGIQEQKFKDDSVSGGDNA